MKSMKKGLKKYKNTKAYFISKSKKHCSNFLYHSVSMCVCLYVRVFVCVCLYVRVWMDGWMDGWMEGWMDGWMDGWVGG